MVREGLTEKVEADRVVKFKFENVGKLPPPVLQVRCAVACRVGGCRGSVGKLPPPVRRCVAALACLGVCVVGLGRAWASCHPCCSVHANKGLAGGGRAAVRCAWRRAGSPSSARAAGPRGPCSSRRACALPSQPPKHRQFTDVTFGYSPDKVLYRHVDLGADLDSRVAIVRAGVMLMGRVGMEAQGLSELPGP